MRDVGGKGLDRLDAVVERRRHVAQRSRQMADLIAPLGEIGNLDPLVDAAPNPLGGAGEPPDRLGYGAREKYREQDCDERNEAEGEKYDLALGEEDVVDFS